MHHLLNIDDLSWDDIDRITRLASDIHRGHFRPNPGRILATLFFEPSTRTKLSFQSAMYRLGGHVIDLPVNSSQAKGESDLDTVRTISEYADVLVIRHPNEVLESLAAVSTKPVISAGESKFEHPTQALLDLYTIKQYQSHKENITIMFTGDLYYNRTVVPLVKIIKKYGMNCKFIFTNERNDYLIKDNINEVTQITESEIDNYLDKIDVLYMTRPQKERWVEGSVESNFILRKESLYKMKADAIVMHPLPRNEEIHPEVDDNYRVKYFQQVRNGVYVRMAILKYILGMSH